MKKLLLATIISLIVFIAFSVSANARMHSSYCDIGYSYNVATNTCEPYWLDFSEDDGRNSYVQLGVQSSNKGYENGFMLTYWLEVICVKQNLLVRVYNYPFGLYANASLYGAGSGQVKFDNTQPKTVKYQRTYDDAGVWLSDARGFVRGLMKSNSSVSFKIFGTNGPHIATFPKGNVGSYEQLLRKKGCNF
jgi:hypothetical protein